MNGLEILSNLKTGGKFSNKWIFNAHTGAMNRKFPGLNQGYDTPEQLLKDLEKWYNQSGIKEGFGWGDPKMIKKDPLHIPGERWRIKWYTNRKTPKMPKEEQEKFIEDLVEQLLMKSPEMKTLKNNKKPLTDEERQKVMDADAVWHMGKDGGPSPAVWKAVVNGKTWYVTNTHRVYQCKPTLKGAIRAYHTVVKQSA